MKPEYFIPWVFVAIPLCCAIYIAAFVQGRTVAEKEAVKAGVAYYTNNASGESVFKWKEVK